ncbi:hypothetical protein LINPERHAP1_LOCUS27188 [Linum perenne]
MANPGVGTNKFLSVNLNKSYGQHQQYHHHHHHNHNQSQSNNQYHSGSAYGRGRPGGGGVGGGGGGMVVLSRPRSSQKAAGPKLSVPPPLNLPSLRKEHEKFDSTGMVGGHAGNGAGNGPRPSSAGIGWTKPAVTAPKQENEGLRSGSDNLVDSNAAQSLVIDQGSSVAVNGFNKGSAYVPPSSRPVVSAVPQQSQGYPVAEKVSVLRGEDFPSLRAALPVNTGLEKKQKDGFSQKQKQAGEVSGDGQRGSSGMSIHVDMRPQFQSQSNAGGGLGESNGLNRGFGGSVFSGKDRKQDYFPGPLPLVRLNPRSDWADDERDTGHVLTDRGRDHGFSKSEVYWDRDFDFPRPSVLPQKPVHNNFDRRIPRDNETGKISSSEVIKVDVLSRDVRSSSREGREGNSWRASPSISKDGYAGQELERSNVGSKVPSLNRETTWDNKYAHSPSRENSHSDVGRKDVGYGQGARPAWNNSSDPTGSRVPEWMHRERSGNEQQYKYRDDKHYNSSMQKPSFSSGGKGLSVNDPILNFGREKRSFSKNDKSYLEDPFMKDYGDPLSGALVGLVKKRKDVLKQADFHDPVRESFEAELERVQKMQEQERQRIIEEQERAVDLARREEEERIQIAREREEQRRRLEEEAREAAWRVEQERVAAVRRAEEQRIAREEEKQRLLLEEERRKQAAKQKLLELEEKIARRSAEATKGGNSISSGITDENSVEMATEKSISKSADVSDWEEGERMVDRITTSTSSDYPEMNRPFDLNPRPYFSRESSSAFVDRGKPVGPWKRDPFDNGNNSTFITHDDENHHGPRRDMAGGRAFPKRELYGGPGFVPSRAYSKGGILDPPTEHFGQFKGPRWNTSGEGDYNRSLEIEPDFSENFVERFDDGGWGYGRPRSNFNPQYHERVYQNPEADGLYPFARSRYSMRQPRVLPPPSIASMQRSSYRGENEHFGASSLVDSERQYSQGTRDVVTMQPGYDSSYTSNNGGVDAFDTLQVNRENEVKKLDANTDRCESQSSLSVSSPPDSPVQLSHDDLDDSVGSPVLSAGKGKEGNSLRGKNEAAALPTDTQTDNVMNGTSIISTGDDEEWALENDDQLQLQEEYDEEDDGYGEDDEVHDGEEDNLNLNQEFEGVHLEDKDCPDMVENLVLGFNEGVEVLMPNDEFERGSGDDQTNFVASHVPVETTDDQTSFDGHGESIQPGDGSSQGNADCSSRIFQETEKALQDLVIQPTNPPQSSATSEHVNQLDSSQVLHSQAQTSTSSVPPVSSQPEVPVKLQFGLFSGPSLIPSPVPAIQIGSIQMPLHLHPPVGPSLAHMAPQPQPPLFQFGQLRYTSPISQGILPLAPQSMSFVPSSGPANFPLNQSVGGSLPPRPGQQAPAQNFIKSDPVPMPRDIQPGILPRQLGDNRNNIVKVQQSSGDPSRSTDTCPRAEPALQQEDPFVRNWKNYPRTGSEGQPRTGTASSQSVSKEKDSSVPKGAGFTSGGRGRRYIFQLKNSGNRSVQPQEASHVDPNSFQRRPRRQRTEFRVRENIDRRQSGLAVSMTDDRSNMFGRGAGARGGSKRVVVSNRQPKRSYDSEGLNSRAVVSSREVDPGSRVEKAARKEPPKKSQNIVHTREDVDSSLQSGIVRIFEQPGIEAPSDDDDFIEVRSKRQMLNDRREQREKEIKAKSRVSKMQRKDRPTPRRNFGPVTSNKTPVAAVGQTSNSIHSDISQGNGQANVEVSAGFSAPLVSQPLPPIGTPALKTDAPADIRAKTIKPLQASSVSVVADNRKNASSSLMFDGNDKVLDNVQASLGSWSNPPRLNQQVMTLTQNQLDDAMKPGQFDSHPSAGDPSNAVKEPSLPSSSILSKEKSFPSSASPINSLLAGEKIQFGAVTSPTILPPTSRAVSHGIGPLGSSRSDVQLSHNLSAAEAEAEAAASAVAVAAITTNDEIVGTGLGAGPVSVTDPKVYGEADQDRATAGVSSDQPSTSHSRAEESLSVALPADLSVENPPISLWPTLASPQHSNQMLSHVPGGPHFPFYEMNPMLGAPIFAFGPHDESIPSQSQSQKSNASSVSGPLGTWQHHAGVDSFYGPPAGFTGPFMTPPPGSIPGVQGPPHMVVYNHFAPVGQFGQVGLSFMGTTYIPSGKQPDWKHNPASSPMGVSEADMNNLAAVSAQRNPANMPPPIQHLAPGSPLLPMGSPLALFDVSPFQSSPDMSAHARWSHIPASTLQSATVSTLHPHPEVPLPPQFSHGPAVDPSSTSNRFTEPRQQAPSDNGRNFAVATDATVTRLPEELGLVDSSSSTNGSNSIPSSGTRNSSSTATTKAMLDAGKPEAAKNGSSSSSSQNFKNQPPHQKNQSAQQYGGSSGYNNYQRGGGGASQRSNSSGGEWSQRRTGGYQGRNHQSGGNDKNYHPSSKTKQIYVAKQTSTTGTQSATPSSTTS